MDSQPNLRLFTGWVLIAQVLGLTSVILVAVWMGSYRGGFAWQEDPGREFNYHPLFMIIGLVFLYGDAIMVYRVFRTERKTFVKILHACIHVLVMAFAGVGLKAVFDSHNLHKKGTVPAPIPNLYSLHSWLGLTTVILFCLQWVFGFVSFLWPKVALSMRTIYKPIHVYFGLAIFVMAIATSLMGITEKAFFSVGSPSYKGVPYSALPAEGVIINILGMVLVALGLVVGYIITNPDYERQPTPEEEHIPLDQ
ncbi:unnamed protein product [Owenia fusiformis]|uniref:Uncharacterized protein n=1 Tax=Owenia fusiformis TaxID=6347 RepID=A0A8J1YAK2_OWEFU|nr:unnamed protein product [Owenia fusiformis]